MGNSPAEFMPLNVAVLTVSDSRDASSDTSGDYLREALTDAGHVVADHALVADNRYRIRAVSFSWIASSEVQAILVNGGTGFHQKNSTPEALLPLFDHQIEGFGEVFRMLSGKRLAARRYSHAPSAGMANQTVIFAVPGSTSACRTAWENIIAAQLDARTRPCHFVSHLKKV